MKLKQNLTQKILTSESLACKALGLNNLKHIDFYNLEGFRIIKTFVVFKHSKDRDRILDQYKKVVYHSL